MQLGERGLELLKVMADGKLYALNALATSTRQHHEVAGRLLGWLAELGLVEKLELRRVDWKRGELGSVKVYRITPEGLKVIGAPQPPAPPSGAAPERPSEEGGAVDRAEGRRRAWDLQLLRIMADGELWGVYALCFALACAVGGSATSGGRYRLVKRHLKRLLERGEVEALELYTAAREGGFATVPVYRITPQGLAALERGAGAPALQPEQRSGQRKRPKQRDPAELLKAMADERLWTLNALAKATGWEKKTVKEHLRRLAEHVEAVEVRKASRKSKTVKTAYVYRLKRAAGPQALSGRRVEPQALGRSGTCNNVAVNPSFDILAAMSDGALWTVGALAAATRHKWHTIKPRLKHLAELGLVEVVEVSAARRRGSGFATVPVYRVTGKGLEALERGLPPELEESAPRPARDPAELLKIMEDGSLWTLNALAKATGWEKKTVRARLQQLTGLVEAVEVRKVSRKSGTLVTGRVYRLKREGSTEPVRGGRRVEPQAAGRPDLDILAALSDGALWTAAALKFATRRAGAVIGWHLRRLAELGLVEAVEVREARRRGPSLSVARLYRITEKGLEALERGLPPLPEVAPPRAEPEPPEGGDPMRLALWVVEWSAYAARILLHLRRSGEDTYSNVAVAAGGYRSMPSKSDFNAILFRLRELDLIEWEHRHALGGRPRRIVRLTEKGRQVAEAILKLATLFAEESGTFL